MSAEYCVCVIVVQVSRLLMAQVNDVIDIDRLFLSTSNHTQTCMHIIMFWYTSCLPPSSAYTCVHIYVWMYTHTHTSTCVHIHSHMHMYTHMHTHAHMHTHTHMQTLCVCVCVCSHGQAS